MNKIGQETALGSISAMQSSKKAYQFTFEVKHESFIHSYCWLFVNVFGVPGWDNFQVFGTPLFLLSPTTVLLCTEPFYGSVTVLRQFA